MSDEIPRGQLLIGGRWQDAERWVPVRNPSDLSDTVGEYAWASADQAGEAIASARSALPQWRASNPQMRSDILRRAGDGLLRRADELARQQAREMGKPIRDARGEVVCAAQIFHFYAGEPVRGGGRFHAGLRNGFSIIVDREPLGVVALITPWNFPFVVPAWKIAAALAYGNTVVFKPSEVTPGCAVALVEVLLEAGLPADAIQLVMGSGAELGDILIAGTDGVSFTGSTATGRRILERAVPTMTRVQLELGGKSPLVVLDDADLDQAVQVAFDGVVPQAGQRCTTSSRLIVTRRIHDAFVEKLAARMAGVKVGHALDPETEVGPVATASQLDKSLEYLRIGLAEGANLVCGGERLDRDTEGYYLSPALFTEGRNDMRISREEIFGPVGTVIRVNDLEEAIVIANDSDYALSSAICTRSMRAAETFRRRSAAGMVVVNAPTSGAEYHVPFAGRRQSGYGAPEQGPDAAEFFTQVKTTYINHGVV